MIKRLTVLIITYNHEDYIEKCIESVLSQQTNFDFNILILDDASTDNTSTIVQKYRKKYPNKIKHIYRKTNVGIVDNVFDGIKKIKSEYYATIEGDDYWCDTHKLQQQVDILETNTDCSFCGHNTEYKDLVNDQNFSIFSQENYTIKNKYQFPQIFNKKKFVKAHPSSRVYRTSCINFQTLRNKGSVVWDSCSYWYFLSKGKMFYIDKVMSVYNYTGMGVFSGKQEAEKKKLSLDNLNMINYEFDYKHGNIFNKMISEYKKVNINKKVLFLLKFIPFTRVKNKLLNKLQKKDAIQLFYSDYKNNFGDILSYILMDTLNKKTIIKNQDPRSADVSFVGSLLEVLMLNNEDNKTEKRPIIIAGSGFIAPHGQSEKIKQEKFCRPVKILGLRGKISKIRMEGILNKKLPNITLGDPGLLASELLDTTGIVKRYDLGIIPHYVDEESEFLKNIDVKNALIIDIKAPTQKILRDIASCNFILSSAMHGLIAADSLNIPNRRIILSDKIVGGDYKFDDYYSVFKKKHPAPIDLRKELISQADIDKFKKEYHISLQEVKAIKHKIKTMINGL
jgi:glycosyltransferase involved in cell wall biosynthesis